MAAQRLHCFVVILLTLASACLASHFRGAIISYKKEDSSDGKIHLSIDYRIAWRRSYGGHFCDSSTIRNGHINSEGSLVCLSNCPGTLGPMDYQCTDFSVDEDWTSGRGHIAAVLPPSASQLYDFGFSSCCWIDSLVIGGGGSWELRVRANLTTRSDTGQVNNPPGSDITPIVRLLSGCNNTIRIPVYDADGDTVRCRWAIGNECSGVCNGFPNSVLDEETCTLTYRSHNPHEHGTWYAVAVQIEDFVQYSSRSQPLSSIPLQFLVNVVDTGVGCYVGLKPTFSESTLPDQSCITVPIGSYFTTNITVITNDNTSIAEIQTISPIGLVKGPLEQDPWNSSVWRMEVSWTSANSSSNNIFCYTAVTTAGVTSEKRCINLLDESLAPRFVELSEDFIRNTFRIKFDKPITTPQESTSILLYERFWYGNESLIERINTSDSDMVQLNGNMLEFNISSTLQPGHQYSFIFDKGLVRGTTFCKPPSSYMLRGFNVSTPVRLVNGTRPSEGRLEIYKDGQWQTKCVDAFTETDAMVICHQLGYIDNFASQFNFTDSTHPGHARGSGSIIKYDLGCTGFETDVAFCNWTNYQYFCNHNDDVWIDCGIQTRLVDGNTTNSGQVEVYYNGSWASVCGGYSFGPKDANAVCRTLGYGTGRNVSVYTWSTIQPLVAMNCRLGVDVKGVGECLMGPEYSCYGVFAGVQCGTEVRLANGHSQYSGRVEVKYQGNWGTVCDDDFDIHDAKVICEMLGYYIGNSYLRAYQSARFGYGTGSIVIDDLACNGTEGDISECTSLPWLTNNCGHGEDASIDCRYGYSYTTTAPTTTVRLVNGNGRYSGRVEVWYNGQWGTICDDSFDHNDVKVICRMLGMNFGDSYGVAYGSARFGQGIGPILVDELNCYGHESVLQQCNSSPWGLHDCGHNEDVGIDCRAEVGSTGSQNTTQYVTTSFPRTTYPYWITTGLTYRLEDAINVNCGENGWNVRVDMYILRRIFPNAVASDIYMGDNSCTGTDRGYDVIFNQGLGDCLTNELTVNNNLVYSNQLVYAEHDKAHPFIIRHFNWTVNIECDVGRNQTSIGHLHHDPNPTQGHQVSGTSEYAVNMTFFSDPNFRNQLQGNPLHVRVGQDVYAKVFSTTTDWTVKMRLHTCYTKPRPSAGNQLNFYIIRDGCEVDSNTHIMSQSTHETRFVFQDFQYTTYSEGIYVYCQATFCDTSDYSRGCTQACNPFAKRSNVIARENKPPQTGGPSDTTQFP